MCVNLSIQLAGQALGKPSIGNVVLVQNSTVQSLVIDRERRLMILQQMQAGSRRLIEFPEPRLPREKPEWTECLRHLDKATQFYQHGEYEQAIIKCRAIVEGIPYVMCDVWGLPPKGKLPFGQWIETIKKQLIVQWPEDTHMPKMIYAMLIGAWDWLAAAPHYGTRVPMREDAAFALGLCTDFLHFTGQVLQVHPDPFPSAS